MRIEIMNGWKEAPHCWKQFLANPIAWKKTIGWFEIEIFGFVVFFLK